MGRCRSFGNTDDIFLTGPCGVSQCAKSGHDALESPVTMLESAVTIPESPVTLRWNDRSRCGGMGGHDEPEYAFARYSAKSFAAILKKLHWQYPEAFVLIVCAEEGHMATMCRWAHYSRIWYDKKDHLMFGHFPDVASKGAKARWITLNGGMEPDHAVTRGIEYHERFRAKPQGSSEVETSGSAA